MSITPEFTTHTESTHDEHDRPVHITVVSMDGVPAFSFVTRPRRGLAPGHEHVASGIIVEERGEHGFHTAVRMSDAPNTGATQFFVEPTVADVVAARMASIDYSRGYAMLTRSPKGTEIPAGESAAFYDGVATAKQRTGRVVRNNKVTGDPRH